MHKPRKLVYTLEIPVRWGDMDAFGHVNNTVYFRYMEQARVEWLESIATPLLHDGQGCVVVSASCNFVLPVVYPATVIVKLYHGTPGRSSVPQFYELFVQGQGETLYAHGQSTLVWVDHHMGKSVPLPMAIRDQVADLAT